MIATVLHDDRLLHATGASIPARAAAGVLRFGDVLQFGRGDAASLVRGGGRRRWAMGCRSVLRVADKDVTVTVTVQVEAAGLQQAAEAAG